jgi:hypothetical protein
LESLRDGYEEWLQDIEGRIPVLRLDWNTYQDPKVIHKKIQKLIKGKKGLIV